MAVQIQLRRDTAANWTSNNPTLAQGEFAIETDTDKYKIGDGSTAWTSLSYSSLPANVLSLAGGAMTGAITTNSTFDGVDIATRDAILSSTTTTAGAALPKAGGAMTGAITTNSTFDGVDVATRDGVLTSTTTTAGAALPKAGGAMTGAITTNSTFDGVDIATRDAILTSTTTTAAAALPKAGGTLTGAIVAADQIISAPVLKDIGETCVANATSGSTDTISLTDGNVHNVTLTANCTFTFAAPPASGTSGSFTLFLNQDGTGSRTATWPAGNGTSTPKVIWAGGTAPTLTTTASRTDILVFTTIDGGMKWYGAVSGQDFS